MPPREWFRNSYGAFASSHLLFDPHAVLSSVPPGLGDSSISLKMMSARSCGFPPANSKVKCAAPAPEGEVVRRAGGGPKGAPSGWVGGKGQVMTVSELAAPAPYGEVARRAGGGPKGSPIGWEGGKCQVMKAPVHTPFTLISIAR